MTRQQLNEVAYNKLSRSFVIWRALLWIEYFCDWDFTWWMIYISIYLVKYDRENIIVLSLNFDSSQYRRPSIISSQSSNDRESTSPSNVYRQKLTHRQRRSRNMQFNLSILKSKLRIDADWPINWMHLLLYLLFGHISNDSNCSIIN